MKKASELRKELGALGLDEDEVNGAIKKAIAKGTAEDDEGDGDGDEGFDEMEKAMSALDKTVDALGKSGQEARAPIAKGGSGVPDVHVDGGDDGEDVTEHVEAIARGTLAMQKAVRDQHAVTADALVALAKGFGAQANLIKAQGRALARLERQNVELAKALGAPVPPRALTGAAPIAHPGEQLNKGGADAAEKWMDEAMAELRNPATDTGRRHRLGKGISLVQEGYPLDQVKAELGL